MYPNSAAELRLLTEIGNEVDAQGPTLELNGRRWTLITFPTTNDELVVRPEYVCVSYIWGSQRTTNPFQPGPRLISINTLPALAAAMYDTNSKAIWIDAFCIPTTQPARRATLESMGFIYSQATEVRVALSKDSFMAVQQLNTRDRLDEAALTALEQDEWVQSVWTYQEVVNSQRLAFLSPDAPEARVDGSHFLNGVGYTLHKYKESNGLDAFAIRERFPRLDALEDLIEDWHIAGYTERSALAVMSNMDRRVWSDESNYFFAMIGAVTDKPCRRVENEHTDLSETFMAICEAKSDFSFIYSSNIRSTDPARRWRPCSGLLPSILSWHCWGESQQGHFDQNGSLWLDKVLQFRISSLQTKAKQHIAKWLHREDLAEADAKIIAEPMYAALVRMGFTGSKEYVSLTDGLFFSQTPLPSGADIDVLVSGTISWTLGAPGIACVSNEVRTYVPGVFVGLKDSRNASSVCLV